MFLQIKSKKLSEFTKISLQLYLINVDNVQVWNRLIKADKQSI